MKLYSLKYLLNILLIMCVFSDAGISQLINNNKLFHITGKVVDNNFHPIAGVVVNDGYHFLKTNYDGKFQFYTDTFNNKFIAISIPSEYEIPNNKGIANGYFIRIPNNIKNKELLFQLNKRKSITTGFWYFAISDPQISDSSDMQRWKNEAVTDLKNYKETIPDKEIYGMALGDIVFDRMDLYNEYKKSMANTGIIMFQTIGNHDHNLHYYGRNYIQNSTDSCAEENFENQFGPINYSVNISDVHIISLNAIDYSKNRKYITRLKPKQIEWLKKDLSFVNKGNLIFLNMHCPTSNKTDSGYSNLKNSIDLLSVLKGYRVHIFAGHTHYFENSIVNDSIYEHNIGAACGAWWIGNVNRCGAPNGYLVTEVKNDKVLWHYKATGKSKDYQFRIYKPGEFKTQARYLVVNVWDWDNTCRIKWVEDGVLKGDMEQFDDEDQIFINQVGAKGYHTQHLFRAIPSADAKNINIEITNRFGEIFTQNISL